MLFQYLAPTSNIPHPKIFNSETGNHTAPPALVDAIFFQRVAHRFEKNELLNTCLQLSVL